MDGWPLPISISPPTPKPPQQNTNSNGYVTIRWRADDYTGASLAHCHILAHVDTGMSLTFEVVDGEQQQEGGDGNGAGGVVVPVAMAVGHHGGARGLRA